MENTGMGIMGKIGIGFAIIVFGLAVFHVSIEDKKSDQALVASIMSNSIVINIVHTIKTTLGSYIKQDALTKTIEGIQNGTEINTLIKNSLPTTIDTSALLNLIPTTPTTTVKK